MNLSDLAAMGATPRSALLSLVLPPGLPLADFEAIVDGFMALAAAHGVALVGGNITRSPGPLIVDVTARRHGPAPAGADPLRRAARRRGLGERRHRRGRGRAAVARGGPRRPTGTWPPARRRSSTPQPRVRLGTLLGRNRAATSCVDLSDGLADGLHQLADASGVGLEIDGARRARGRPRRTAWFESRGQDPRHGGA